MKYILKFYKIIKNNKLYYFQIESLKENIELLMALMESAQNA